MAAAVSATMACLWSDRENDVATPSAAVSSGWIVPAAAVVLPCVWSERATLAATPSAAVSSGSMLPGVAAAITVPTAWRADRSCRVPSVRMYWPWSSMVVSNACELNSAMSCAVPQWRIFAPDECDVAAVSSTPRLPVFATVNVVPVREATSTFSMPARS